MPGTKKISVKIKLTQNTPDNPFDIATATGGKKIASIICKILIVKKIGLSAINQ